MKYIILDGIFPLIFPNTMNHSDFKDINNHRCTSAGFMLTYIDDNTNALKVSTFGSSTSLNLIAKDKDNILIERLLTD